MACVTSIFIQSIYSEDTVAQLLQKQATGAKGGNSSAARGAVPLWDSYTSSLLSALDALSFEAQLGILLSLLVGFALWTTVSLLVSDSSP